jgi:hypothetical protein
LWKLLRLIGWVEIMGCWDEYCVVCGGPPCAPDPEVYYDAGSGGEGETEVNAKGPSALNRQDFAWLRSFVDVNEAEELQVGGYLEDYTDYGGMRPYQSQFFRFGELFLDGKEWMLQDPMAHRENAERILQVWRPIVESGFKVSKRKQPKRDAAKEGVAALEQGSGF